MAGSHSPERPRPADDHGWLANATRVFAGLGRHERLAAFGAIVCIGAVLLPWYRARVSSLVITGAGDFNFATAALMVTAGAALLLVVRGGRGGRLPLPLHEGTLLAVAGAWAGAIVVYLMFDRPELSVGGFTSAYGLSYGIFVELGGAAIMALAGLRLRGAELRRDAAAGAPSPTSAFPPRSPR